MGFPSYSRRSLPEGGLLRGRVQEHAALEQRAVHVADHRPDVAARVAAGVRVVQVPLVALGEVVPVGLVERVDLLAGGHLESRLDEHEVAQVGIQHEHVDAASQREDHQHRGAVDDVARGELPLPGLEHAVGIVRQNAEDRPHADGDVDVRRSVEGVEDDAEVPAVRPRADVDGLVFFLGGADPDARTAPQTLQQDLVGDHVELLLCLAVHVLVAGIAQDVGEARAPHLVCDRARGEGDRVDDVDQLGRAVHAQLPAREVIAQGAQVLLGHGRDSISGVRRKAERAGCPDRAPGMRPRMVPAGTGRSRVSRRLSRSRGPSSADPRPSGRGCSDALLPGGTDGRPARRTPS